MGAILSKKESKQHNKSNTITPLDRAILDLKNSRDRLTKYRTKLDQDCTKLTTRAASLHSSGKTSTALQLLRLRKYKLKEAERVDEQLLTVLRMVDKIAEKQNEAELVEAMRRGKDALRILHEEMGVEDVLSLMDEIRDQDEVEKRINEVLGGEGLRVVEDMGEEDILMELEQLEEEVRLESDAKGKEEVESLPAVPTKPLPKMEEARIEEAGATKVVVAS